MSSDSQPSFRFNVKNKLKKVIDPARKHLISNETYQHIQEKTQNLTNILQNRSIIDTVKNKTRGIISEIRPSNDNRTVSEGFYDSLFTPDTVNEVYFEVVVVCLWIVAMLCIIPTIIVTLIPSKNFGVKMILFHVFLCEFLYLIYVLLSMINIAQNFQLHTVFCFIANYGMYVTIPVMYFAILFLSLERVAKRFNPNATWTKIFANGCLIQVVLLALWAIAIGIFVGILLFKFQFNWGAIVGRVSKIAPSVVTDMFNKITPSVYHCSIDGRLSSIFKVLFIVLFVLLILLIVKSLVITIFYSSLVPSCSRNRPKRDDRDLSVIYAVILLLNLFFSAPFYVISMANSIYTLIKPKEEPYPMILKIFFLLRIISIILQCLTFHVIEKSAWKILNKLLNCVTRGKFPMLADGESHGKPPNNHHQRDAVSSRGNQTGTRSKANQPSIDFDKNLIAVKRSTKTRVDATTSECETDDEKIQEQKSTVREKTRSTEQTPLKSTPTNGKSVSQRTTSAAIETRKTNTPYDSIPSSSSDESSSTNGETSDDEVALPVIAQSNPPVHSSPRRQYRPRQARSGRPVRVRSHNRYHVKTVAKRKKSPRNACTHAAKSEPDRLSKMLARSDDV